MSPIEFISGRIRPPAAEIRNPKILRRHIHAVALGSFFRAHPERFRTVSDFFSPDDQGITGCDLFADWLRSRHTGLREAIEAVVPSEAPELREELGVDEWLWVDDLLADAGDGQSDGALSRAADEVRTDLETYAALEKEAVEARKYPRAEAFRRQAERVRGRQLIGFLASRNVLPKYGFPVDVVELRLPPADDASQELELQRDLKIALSEYAPGGQIVAGHRMWTSTGIRRLPHRDPEEFAYAVCGHWGRFHKSILYADLPAACQACGEPLRGRRLLAGTLIVPEYGFFSNAPSDTVGMSRPRRLYSSRAYFSEYASAKGPDAFASIRHPQGGPTVHYRYARQGKLAVVNSGLRKQGFAICRASGYAEAAPNRRSRRRVKAHRSPYGTECRGTLEVRHLGHEFLTDVLEIRFSGQAPSGHGVGLWWSLTYALLLGASEALGIERDDIDGCLYPYGERGDPPALVVYDSVPGGAGHVKRVGEHLPLVLSEAARRVALCDLCAEDSACYGCLKTYGNQFCHHLLSRGSAARFLEQWSV